MDLDLNIEQGGKSDQIGKALEQSTADLGKSMVEETAYGAANVVASTGINAGVGTTDEIIADNIAAGVNLTGRLGLTNLAKNLLGYTLNLTEMGMDAPEKLVDTLLKLIDEVLAENGIIDEISKSMTIAKGTTDLLLQGLKVASSGVTIAGNISKLMTLLNKMQDVEITCIPTVKDATSAFAASLIDQVVAQYTALKELLIIFYNSMICTSNDNVIDNMVVSINSTLTVLEPLLDLILNDYTGYTVNEVRNLCNLGLAYAGMIERAAAAKQKANNEKVTPVGELTSNQGNTSE